MKSFFKLFVLVFFAEVMLGMLSLLLEQKSELYPLAGIISSLIMSLLSLPFSLIDRTYPYYSIESEWFNLLMIVTTLIVHTLLVFVIYKSSKRR